MMPVSQCDMLAMSAMLMPLVLVNATKMLLHLFLDIEVCSATATSCASTKCK